MKNYKFLFNNLSIKNLYKVSKKIKKISKKKLVIIDMLNCSLKYQATYDDYLKFEFYNLTDEQRKTYLTKGLNKKIIETLNNKDYFYILEDKNYFNDYFKEYLNRNYLNTNSSKENFYKFIQNKANIIIKSKNDIKIEPTKNLNYSNINNCILEEVIPQHKKLNELYSNSVNSIKIITFYDGEKVTILQSVLKIGNNNITNTLENCGLYAFLNNKGIVVTPAIDKDDNIFGIHPISKKQILGFNVPLYDDIKDLAIELSKKIPQIPYVCWNITITDNKPCLISASPRPSIYQIKPRFSKNKIGNLEHYQKIMNIDI